MNRRVSIVLLSVLFLALVPCARGADDPGCAAGVMLARTTNLTDAVYLPLKQTDVNITVLSGIVSATVEQQFLNDTSHPLEVVYIFPLPMHATVTDMQLVIGNRRIRSVVQERAQAKQTYEAAKQAGKATALMEEQRPNLFKTSVANVLPGETIDVMFTYTERAHHAAGVYSLTFPMVVERRYFPELTDTNGVPGETTAINDVNPPVLHPSLDPEHRVRITVEIYGLPLDHVISSTHALKMEPVPGFESAQRVTLAEELAFPDNAFNLELHLHEQSDPAVGWVDSTDTGPGYGVLTVFPPLEAAATEPPPRDVVFLVDTSGSMGGSSIQQARAGLLRCLDMLRDGDRFNIVRFSSDFSQFVPEPVAFDADTLAAAQDYVMSLTSNGGTEMQPALAHVLESLTDSPNLPLVIFLTDGAVGNEHTLMQLLRSHLGRVRLFTFGIGSAPNDFLMNKMAELGRGQARFIRTHEDIGRVMDEFFRTLASPVLTDVTVAWFDAQGTLLENLETYPQPVPDVFLDRPLQCVVSFGDPRPAEVVIRGRTGDQIREFAAGLAADPFTHGLAGTLFARAQTDELLTQLIVCALTPEQKQTLVQQVTEIALEHQIVTRYTSRVAVEEEIARNPDGTLTTVRVATPTPRAWDPFTATATRDLTYFIAGFSLLLAGLALHMLRKHLA